MIPKFSPTEKQKKNKAVVHSMNYMMPVTELCYFLQTTLQVLRLQDSSIVFDVAGFDSLKKI